MPIDCTYQLLSCITPSHSLSSLSHPPHHTIITLFTVTLPITPSSHSSLSHPPHHTITLLTVTPSPSHHHTPHCHPLITPSHSSLSPSHHTITLLTVTLPSHHHTPHCHTLPSHSSLSHPPITPSHSSLSPSHHTITLFTVTPSPSHSSLSHPPITPSHSSLSPSHHTITLFTVTPSHHTPHCHTLPSHSSLSHPPITLLTVTPSHHTPHCHTLPITPSQPVPSHLPYKPCWPLMPCLRTIFVRPQSCSSNWQQPVSVCWLSSPVQEHLHMRENDGGEGEREEGRRQ